MQPISVSDNISVALGSFDQLEDKVVYDRRAGKFIPVANAAERDRLPSADFAKGTEMRNIFRNYVEEHINEIDSGQVGELYSRVTTRIDTVIQPWQGWLGIKGFLRSFRPWTTDEFLQQITFLRTLQGLANSKLKEFATQNLENLGEKAMRATLRGEAREEAAAASAAARTLPSARRQTLAVEVVTEEPTPSIESPVPSIESPVKRPPPPPMPKGGRRTLEGEPVPEPPFDARMDVELLRALSMRNELSMDEIRSFLHSTVMEKLMQVSDRQRKENLSALIGPEIDNLLKAANTPPKETPSYTLPADRQAKDELAQKVLAKLTTALDQIIAKEEELQTQAKSPSARPIQAAKPEQRLQKDIAGAVTRHLKDLMPALQALVNAERLRLIDFQALPIQNYLDSYHTVLKPVRDGVGKAHALHAEINEIKSRLTELDNRLEQHQINLGILSDAIERNEKQVALNVMTGKRKDKLFAPMPFYSDEAFEEANLHRREARLEPLSNHNRISVALEEQRAKKEGAFQEWAGLQKEKRRLERELSEVTGQNNNGIPFSAWENVLNTRQGPITKWQKALDSRLKSAFGMEQEGKSAVKLQTTKSMEAVQALHKTHPEMVSFDQQFATAPGLRPLLNEKDNPLSDMLAPADLDPEKVEPSLIAHRNDVIAQKKRDLAREKQEALRRMAE